MQDYRKLKVWQKAHDLALKVYKATAGFPQNEIYALTSQLRRAVVSIPSNIFEGCGRDGINELKQFMNIAMGSANEAEYQLLLASELGYISNCDHENLQNEIMEIRKMLSSYINKIKMS